MGKTKWSSETDNGSKHQQSGQRLSVSRPARRAFPGRSFLNELENVPLSVLLRQIWIRLKRHWWALRFRLRIPDLQENTALKLILAVILAYLLFFTNLLPWAWPGGNAQLASESMIPGGRSKAGKSIFGKTPAPAGANGAAPVSARQMTREMADSYIATFSALAMEDMRRYGVPASISLAQGLVESRAGESTLARRNNNHFGIKCFSRRCRKGHCSNFTDDTHKDFFRIFATPADSWKAHSIMISTGRYARLKQHGRDYRKWAYGLKSLGYATDATYAEKLIEMIEMYDLQRFDR
jgi:flagellum-specific peptidoglycan hydrolase FlgJ